MEMTMTTDEISAEEAAARLGLHPVTVARMCREKRLQARKIGGRGPWRIRASALVPSDTTPTPQSDGTTSTPESPAAPPSRQG